MIISSQANHPSAAAAPSFRVLSPDQCDQIFQAALECLQRVGVIVQNAEGRELLAAAGAQVEGDRVRIPAHVIQNALKTTPPDFDVWGRDGRVMHIAHGQVNFGPGPTCTYFIDPFSGERRKAQRGDAGLTAKVCDALPNMDYVMGLSLFDDVTAVLSPVYEFAETMINTSKPVVAWANTPATLQAIFEMAAAVAGSEEALRRQPNFMFFTTYESPLKLADHPVANMLWAAEHDIPVICLGGPTVGSEAPFTGAAALVLHLAPVLCALTMVQLKKPGAPMVLGGVPSMMDVRSGRPAYGSPEMSLHSAAAVDVARFLKVPFMGTAGASESKAVDLQAGIEASIQVVFSALSGASLVHDVGFLDCADIGSLKYLVVVDEVISMTKRLMRGITVTPDTLMLDLIEKVGPGGSFLSQARSASLCRAEAWVPSVLERSAYAIWEKKGQKNSETLAGEKLQKILTTHTPAPLQEDVVKRLAEIIETAEQALLL